MDNAAIPSFRPTGVLAAMVTPFKADESLDEARAAAHIDFLIEAGIRGVVPIGGCGEYANLRPVERQRMIDVTLQAVNGRVPVVVGALATSTLEVLDVGAFAARAGATALLVLPPYYIRPSLAGIVDHFARVASETGLPIIAYNNPPRTGWSMDVAALEAIAAVPSVVAVKDCDRDLTSIANKIMRVGDQISYLCGDDDLVFVEVLSGAHGAIMATPNLAPRLCIELYAACASGDVAAARRLQNRFLPLVQVRQGPNHPGPLKELMAMAGRPVGPARRPLLGMTDAQRAAAPGVLETSGPIC